MRMVIDFVKVHPSTMEGFLVAIIIARSWLRPLSGISRKVPLAMGFFSRFITPIPKKKLRAKSLAGLFRLFSLTPGIPIRYLMLTIKYESSRQYRR